MFTNMRAEANATTCNFESTIDVAIEWNVPSLSRWQCFPSSIMEGPHNVATHFGTKPPPRELCTITSVPEVEESLSASQRMSLLVNNSTMMFTNGQVGSTNERP
jgi:hypothetical protein